MIRTYKNGDTAQLSPHFRALEFQCKCGTRHEFQLDDELVEKMEQFFTVVPKLFGVKVKTINVSSGFRCAQHDKNVGGSGTGQHTLGRAADYTIILEDGSTLVSWKVCIASQEIGFRGIARINDGYTHSDTRSGKWYGDETKGSSFCIPCADFYEYFNVERKGDSRMRKNGIDVSTHQEKIDWQKVKAAGIDFAILRAGYGRLASQKDDRFEDNYAGAKVAGIPVGAYWYSYAMSEDEARQEADAFLSVIKGKQFEMPVYFDLEEKKQFNLGKEKVSAIMRAFLERVEAAGYFVGLYCSASSLTTHTASDIRVRYTIWLAHWVDQTNYKGAYDIWQHSEKGRVDGISGDVDLDICYKDFPTIIKAKGLNGYGKPIEKPPEPAADDGIPFRLEIGGQTYVGRLDKV